ncbi:hypothetical protein LCGC14_2434280 [marine sediment metagenome]|uniref:HTH gntR-type domain-containing protein n=1 Tax=marine sediment metagenome TaxID=412755 RepID=A0A0F9BKY4_9ZZZZ
MKLFIRNEKIRLREQVADRIRELIVREDLQPGDTLPIYLDLRKKFDVSVVTLKRSMDILAAEGLVRRVRGRGTFLVKPVPPESQRISQIGVVFYGSRRLLFTQAYLMEIFQGVLLRADEIGADLRIFSLVSGQTVLTPEQVLTDGVQGVILLGIVNQDCVVHFAAEGVPTVVLDYCTDAAPLDYLMCENAEAVRRTVQHLVDLGHKRIDYVDGWTTDPLAGEVLYFESPDVRERRTSYERAMASAGLISSQARQPRHRSMWRRAPAVSTDVGFGIPRRRAGVRRRSDPTISESPAWQGTRTNPVRAMPASPRWRIFRGGALASCRRRSAETRPSPACRPGDRWGLPRPK